MDEEDPGQGSPDWGFWAVMIAALQLLVEVIRQVA